MERDERDRLDSACFACFYEDSQISHLFCIADNQTVIIEITFYIFFRSCFFEYDEAIFCYICRNFEGWSSEVREFTNGLITCLS